MEKARIGILTFSDGREFVHRELLPMNQRFLDYVCSALEETGEVEVVPGEEIIWKPEIALKEAKRMLALDVDGIIFNFSIWSFPHLAVISAQNARPPYLLLSNINPQYPGLVGMLASAGSLEQLGIPHVRVFGDIRNPEVLRSVLAFCRAAKVVHRLRGQTYGLFGGRSMGMYTAVSGTDIWQKVFGVDVEHIDQMEIVRLSQEVPEEKVERAFKWLEENIGEIHYDGKNLTPEILKKQIRSYYATKKLVEEWDLDFFGIKCQPELSNNFVTQCLTQAFSNDPYDWDGEKEPVVCACEVDMDGGMTMQILKLLSGSPTLFMDFRHWDEKENIFVFSNCGSQATYYAGKSSDPKENLKNVHLYPQSFYFPAGGATVQYVGKAGEVTIARLARRNGKYWMAIIPGEFVEYPREKCKETQEEWPQCFARLSVKPEELIARYPCNHAHAIYGNWVEELKLFCSMLGIEAEVFA